MWKAMIFLRHCKLSWCSRTKSGKHVSQQENRKTGIREEEKPKGMYRGRRGRGRRKE